MCRQTTHALGLPSRSAATRHQQRRKPRTLRYRMMEWTGMVSGRTCACTQSLSRTRARTQFVAQTALQEAPTPACASLHILTVLSLSLGTPVFVLSKAPLLRPAVMLPERPQTLYHWLMSAAYRDCTCQVCRSSTITRYQMMMTLSARFGVGAWGTV